MPPATVGCSLSARTARPALEFFRAMLVGESVAGEGAPHRRSATGLPGPDLTSGFRDRDGGLWFGSYNGLFRLVPGADRRPSTPVVLIAGLRVAGEGYLTSDLGESDVPRFELKPNRNQVHIEFFGLGGGSGNRVRFRSFLRGLNSRRRLIASGWPPRKRRREPIHPAAFI